MLHFSAFFSFGIFKILQLSKYAMARFVFIVVSCSWTHCHSYRQYETKIKKALGRKTGVTNVVWWCTSGTRPLVSFAFIDNLLSCANYYVHVSLCRCETRQEIYCRLAIFQRTCLSRLCYYKYRLIRSTADYGNIYS